MANNNKENLRLYSQNQPLLLELPFQHKPSSHQSSGLYTPQENVGSPLKDFRIRKFTKPKTNSPFPSTRKTPINHISSDPFAKPLPNFENSKNASMSKPSQGLFIPQPMPPVSMKSDIYPSFINEGRLEYNRGRMNYSDLGVVPNFSNDGYGYPGRESEPLGNLNRSYVNGYEPQAFGGHKYSFDYVSNIPSFLYESESLEENDIGGRIKGKNNSTPNSNTNSKTNLLRKKLQLPQTNINHINNIHNKNTQFFVENANKANHSPLQPAPPQFPPNYNNMSNFSNLVTRANSQKSSLMEGSGVPHARLSNMGNDFNLEVKGGRRVDSNPPSSSHSGKQFFGSERGRLPFLFRIKNEKNKRVASISCTNHESKNKRFSLNQFKNVNHYNINFNKENSDPPVLGNVRVIENKKNVIKNGGTWIQNKKENIGRNKLKLPKPNPPPIQTTQASPFSHHLVLPDKNKRVTKQTNIIEKNLKNINPSTTTGAQSKQIPEGFENACYNAMKNMAVPKDKLEKAKEYSNSKAENRKVREFISCSFCNEETPSKSRKLNGNDPYSSFLLTFYKTKKSSPGSVHSTDATNCTEFSPKNIAPLSAYTSHANSPLNKKTAEFESFFLEENNEEDSSLNLLKNAAIKEESFADNVREMIKITENQNSIPDSKENNSTIEEKRISSGSSRPSSRELPDCFKDSRNSRKSRRFLHLRNYSEDKSHHLLNDKKSLFLKVKTPIEGSAIKARSKIKLFSPPFSQNTKKNCIPPVINDH